MHNPGAIRANTTRVSTCLALAESRSAQRAPSPMPHGPRIDNAAAQQMLFDSYGHSHAFRRPIHRPYPSARVKLSPTGEIETNKTQLDSDTAAAFQAELLNNNNYSETSTSKPCEL